MAEKQLPQYKVLSEIRYAGRRWEAGDVVNMPRDRAEKFLNAHQIEAIAPAKEAN